VARGLRRRWLDKSLEVCSDVVQVHAPIGPGPLVAAGEEALLSAAELRHAAHPVCCLLCKHYAYELAIRTRTRR